MTNRKATIRFKAPLLKPAAPDKGPAWCFFILPKAASAKLPTRAMTSVQGTLNGFPFAATLKPDGHKSHWLKVNEKLREGANATVGDMVSLDIAPVAKEPEPRVPADLRKALAGDPEAQATWFDITPVARRDWIHWITSGKRAETRARRIDKARDMLASGKRRACCFDRSGVYSKAFAAPLAADQ